MALIYYGHSAESLRCLSRVSGPTEVQFGVCEKVHKVSFYFGPVLELESSFTTCKT